MATVRRESPSGSSSELSLSEFASPPSSISSSSSSDDDGDDGNDGSTTGGRGGGDGGDEGKVLAAAEPFRAALTDVELQENDPTDSQQQDDKIISVNAQEVDDDIQGSDMGSTIPDDAPAETQVNS